MTHLIEKFYTAFKNLDAETMAACYHDDVVFEDPAFGKLKGEEAKSMWKMLLGSQKGKEFHVTFSDIKANETNGSAKWEAKYKFSILQRDVHNKVEAKFEFKDGLIIKHTDEFSVHKWAKQALGSSVSFISWTGFFKKKLQAQTRVQLERYMDSR